MGMELCLVFLGETDVAVVNVSVPPFWGGVPNLLNDAHKLFVECNIDGEIISVVKHQLEQFHNVLEGQIGSIRDNWITFKFVFCWL